MIISIRGIGIYAMDQLDLCIFISIDDRLAPEWYLTDSFYTNNADKPRKDIL